MPLSVSYKNQKKSRFSYKDSFLCGSTAHLVCVVGREKVTAFVPASVGATSALNGFPGVVVPPQGGAHTAPPKITLGLFDFVCPKIFGRTSGRIKKTKIIATFVPFLTHPKAGTAPSLGSATRSLEKLSKKQSIPQLWFTDLSAAGLPAELKHIIQRRKRKQP